MLTSAQLTKRRQQKVLAASPLATGSDASLVVDTVAGSMWRAQDGCCNGSPNIQRDKYKIALINRGDSCPPTYTCLEICTLLQFNPPIPVGQEVTLWNLTGNPVNFYIGNDNQIPILQVSVTGSVNPGDTYTISAVNAQNQTAFYYNDPQEQLCPNS